MNILFTPIKLGKVTVKNRLKLLSVAPQIGDGNGYSTEREIEYYKAIAKNGPGLIVPGALPVDQEWPCILKGQPYASDDKFLPNLKHMVNELHDCGAIVFYQIWHPGMVNYTNLAYCRTVGEITNAEIKTIEQKMIEAGIRVYKSGADGIELPIVHNYLATQFFNSNYNTRTDEYSMESFENMIRFFANVYDGVRAGTAEDFPIGFKLEADAMNPGGIDLEMAKKIARFMEEKGACFVSVSAGGKLRRLDGMSGTGFQEEGWKAPLAKAIKEVVNIPVVATGTIRHPEYAAKLIEDGVCDMIGMGREFICEPDWVEKVQQGREDELRYCTNCWDCFGNTGLGITGCANNPTSWKEYRKFNYNQDGAGRRVIIVGAGPSGCEAAIVLAKRGFRVIILEKTNRVGGDFALESRLAGHDKWAWQVQFYENMLKKYNIEVVFNTTATPEIIKSYAPEAIFLATGTRTAELKVPGAEKVIDLRLAIDGGMNYTNRNVVVIGANEPGIAAATDLALKGNKAVVIDNRVNAQPPTGIWNSAMMNAMMRGVKLEFAYKILEILDEGVKVMDLKTQQESVVPADVVLLATAESNETLFDAVKYFCPIVRKVGACDYLRLPAQITQSGHDAAYLL